MFHKVMICCLQPLVIISFTQSYGTTVQYIAHVILTCDLLHAIIHNISEILPDEAHIPAHILGTFNI